MSLDIRLPIGVMFSVIGILLAVYGAAPTGNSPVYEHSVLININFWWGLVMLAFGAIMLTFGIHAARKHAPKERDSDRISK